MTAPQPEHHPGKRAAFEPVERLLQHTGYDPAMKRPMTIVAGVALVLLGVAVGVMWIADYVAHMSEYSAEILALIGDESVTPEEVNSFLYVIAGFLALVLVVEIVLAVLIFRGVNWARVFVMLVAVSSISTSFVSWWAQGQEITLQTTFLSLALDILVLLALSSRSAAAYARRNERH